MQTKKLYDEYMITSMVPGFDPVEVESAEGTRIRSSSGEEYLDCFSGIAVCNAGHGHPKVIAAAKAQIDRLVHCCTYVYYNPQAGRLAEAGVKIAFASGAGGGFGPGGPHASRTTMYEAATAAAHGLDREAALKALTLWPAEILGVADRLGSIAPGRLGNLVITDGDPLEIATRVQAVVIAGREASTANRHRSLWERYRGR